MTGRNLPTDSFATLSTSGYNYEGGNLLPKSLTEEARILFLSDSAIRRECIGRAFGERAATWRITCLPEDGVRDEEAAVVIVDLKSRLLDASAFDALTGRLRAFAPAAALIALTDRQDVAFAEEALRHGWRGCITATLGADIAIAAIRLVIAGGVYVPSGMIRHFVSMTKGTVITPAPADMSTLRRCGPLPGIALTPRELEILEHLEQGKPNKLIAFALSISESTVKVHIRNLMRKLNATNRTQLAFMHRGGALHAVGVRGTLDAVY